MDFNLLPLEQIARRSLYRLQDQEYRLVSKIILANSISEESIGHYLQLKYYRLLLWMVERQIANHQHFIAHLLR